MIDLTPLDVRKKKQDFRKSMRGYDTGEVDAFLDLVADRLEELIRERETLRERTESFQEQLGQYREREKALNEALLAAQELREEARSQAERQAAVRLREAETHAEAILLEADQAIRRSQRRLEEIQSQREHFLRQLRGLLQRFADNLEVEESRLRAEPDELGDLLAKLEREGGSLRPDRVESIELSPEEVPGDPGEAPPPEGAHRARGRGGAPPTGGSAEAGAARSTEAGAAQSTEAGAAGSTEGAEPVGDAGEEGTGAESIGSTPRERGGE